MQKRPAWLPTISGADSDVRSVHARVARRYLVSARRREFRTLMSASAPEVIARALARRTSAWSNWRFSWVSSFRIGSVSGKWDALEETLGEGSDEVCMGWMAVTRRVGLYWRYKYDLPLRAVLIQRNWARGISQ